MNTSSLSDIPVGSRATVTEVTSTGPLAGRLADLGFLPGTLVTCLRRAPLGDPRVYELRGVQLCLRRQEARLVQVREPVNADG